MVTRRNRSLLAIIAAELLARRRFRASAPEGSATHFHEQVETALVILTPRLFSLAQELSEPAVGAALAIQLTTCLSHCISNGQMSTEGAQSLVLKVAALEFKDGDFFTCLTTPQDPSTH
jgi:hypothetical protein